MRHPEYKIFDGIEKSSYSVFQKIVSSTQLAVRLKSFDMKMGKDQDASFSGD